MSKVVKKPFRRVGVGAQYICFGDPRGNIPYEAEVIKNKTVKQIQTTEGGSPTMIYASNEVYDVDSPGVTPSLSVENVAFDPTDLARMKGRVITGGFVTSNQFDEPIKFAYGVVYPKRGNHNTYVWYPCCILTESSNAAQTMDDSGPNTQNPSSTIQTMPFNDNGDYRIAYDTEMLGQGETPMTEAEFFASVLTEIPVVI